MAPPTRRNVRAGTASSARWQPTGNAADAAREPPGLWEYFVHGAPAIARDNVNPSRGLANGTDCTCRGLYWANPADQQAALAAIARAMPGDMVDVPPPTVSLDHLTVRPGDEACTLQPGSEDTPSQVLAADTAREPPAQRHAGDGTEALCAA